MGERDRGGGGLEREIGGGGLARERERGGGGDWRERERGGGGVLGKLERPNSIILKLNLFNLCFFYNPKVRNATARDTDRKRQR